MKIPAIIATTLLLWGFASASGPFMLGGESSSSASASASAAASSETWGGGWRKGGAWRGNSGHAAAYAKAGSNNIISRVGAPNVVGTMIASAAVEAKAGLREGKETAERQREALQLLVVSADKNAQARVLADDAAVLVQGAAEAQSVAAAKTIAVEKASASLAAAAIEAEAAAATSKISANQALQEGQTSASALKTSAGSAMMTLKLARAQGAASANAAVQMEKALVATREADIAAQKAMAAESAAAAAAAIAAARQSEARDAGAEAKAAAAALIAAQRNLVQAKARAAMAREEAEFDVQSRASDAKVNAIARAASKASIRKEQFIEVGADFGQAKGEVIITGTRSHGGKGAIATGEAKSSASAIGIKKMGHHNHHRNWGHPPHFKHGGFSISSAAANAESDASSYTL